MTKFAKLSSLDTHCVCGWTSVYEGIFSEKSYWDLLFNYFPKNLHHRPQPVTSLTKKLLHRCFPVNFGKFFYRTPLGDCFWNLWKWILAFNEWATSEQTVLIYLQWNFIAKYIDITSSIFQLMIQMIISLASYNFPLAR